MIENIYLARTSKNLIRVNRKIQNCIIYFIIIPNGTEFNSSKENKNLTIHEKQSKFFAI